MSHLACAQSAGSQEAKPVIPQTPDVVVPPPLTLPPPAEVQVGARPLGVQEAIAIALQKQAQIAAARGNFLSAQGSTQRAAASLLPQVSGSAGYGDQRQFRGGGGGGVIDRFNAGISLNQLLYDFGRTRDQVRQEQALERASGHELTNTQLSVALQVKLDYYSLAQARADVALSEADVANRQRQLDEASARVTAGIGPPSDLVQAKTNLADAAIALVSFRDSALTSQVALAQDLGVEPRTPLNPDTSVEPALASETSLQDLVKAALGSRPDIKSAEEQVVAAGYGVSAARKGNLPVATISTGLAGRGPNDPFATQLGTVGLNVTWTFDDSGAAAGEIKQAKGAEEAARANLVLVSQGAVTAVSGAYLDLTSALQRQTLAQAEVANAQELVRISEGRYEGGLGQFLDITNAQNSLVAAQRNLTQAQADIQRARARLRNGIGAY